MRVSSLRDSGASALQRLPLLPIAGAALLAVVAVAAGPAVLTMAVIGAAGAALIAARPQWGVAIILTTLMVQYGNRRYEREGFAGLASLVPAGSGLFTVNNMLGLFLALLLVYQLYRDGDWSFLHSRPLQLMALITAVFALAGFMSGIEPADFADVGLMSTVGQDPVRLLVSRGLFLVLFVFFIRRPSDLRMMVGVFVFLALLTAWSGTGAAITGSGRPEIADYRAGGTEVLIQSSQNPNRLALVSTIALVMIWEFAQSERMKRWRPAAIAAALLFVLTVFLSASRGGLIGMSIAGVLLFARRRGGSGRFVYGAIAALVGTLLIGEIVPQEAFERLSNIPGLSSNDGGSDAGEGSVQRRAYTYRLGFDLWAKAPLIGVGPGNWPLVRFLNDPLRSAAAPHSSYMQALVEGGLAAFVLYIVLFYTTLRDLWRCEASPQVMAQAEHDGIDWLLAATRICLLTFMIFSLFADLWDLVFAYFLLGLAAVLIQRYLPLANAPQGMEQYA
ncbi:MAG: O-antigen ligase family protein [Deltaproteobacteria bacterium]|nr:O-antigen ligase family protein [Deltaproteobacteria bacterium]